jgi:hypothetical protein
MDGFLIFVNPTITCYRPLGVVVTTPVSQGRPPWLSP